jgi:hypothetical protein
MYLPVVIYFFVFPGQWLLVACRMRRRLPAELIAAGGAYPFSWVLAGLK